MSTYLYGLKEVRKGYDRVLRYMTTGLWACPEIADAMRQGCYDLDPHECAATGKVRYEPVADGTVTTTVSDGDGAELITTTRVQRKFHVAKTGPRPRCKCGREMVWLGYRVTLRDEKRDGGRMFRYAGDDVMVWTKYGRTKKERDRIVDAALAKGR